MDYFYFLRSELYDIRRFVFLDESHINDRSRERLWGYSFRGVRPRFRYAMVRGQKYTVSVAAGYQGIVDYLVMQGSCNSHTFFEWFVTSLFASLPENAIIVLDNASIHHYQPFIILCGYLEVTIIYLPPYCPFLNPVENIFSALKSAVMRYRREVEIDPLRALALILEAYRDFDIPRVLRSIGYQHVCKFPRRR